MKEIIHPSVEKHINEIKELMIHYKVEHASVFGSAVKGNFNDSSDVDFLIKFNPSLDFETYSDNYFALMYALQKLLNRDVELVAEETITNKYFEQSINESRVSIL